MNYSIRNLVIAGGLAIAAIAAVLIYTSNVQQAAKEGQARVKVMVARVDIPAGTPAKDIIARGDLIQQEIVQDDQLPGVLTTTDGLERQRAEAGSVHRPAGLEPGLRPDQRGRLHRRHPRHDTRRRRRRQDLQRPRRHAARTATTSTSTPQIGSGNSRIVRKVLTNVLVLQGPDRREGHHGRRATRTSCSRSATATPRRCCGSPTTATTASGSHSARRRSALNSPPTVETLQTVLGDGLPAAVQKLIKGLLNPARSDSVSDAIRIFISGSCAGLAEVRQALSSHDAIKVVGTAVDAPSAGDRLREEQVDVLLHGSSRGDRLPTQDIHTLQSASPAPIVIVTSGCTPEFLQEALAHGVQDVAILPQLTESLVFTLRRAHVLNHNAARPQAQATGPARSGGEGRVITVFSPKGGVGKSTISTGLVRRLLPRAQDAAPC